MVFVGSCLVFLYRERASLGGPDFFFYLCYARDLVQDPVSVSLLRYQYFPGVYAFWRAAIRVVGDPRLEALQSVYLGVLVVNGVIVGAIVLRTLRSWLASLFAVTWYWVLCSRFQGLEGVAEPIATIPFLLGILCWSGGALVGWAGMARAAGLGLSLGLAVYVRQHAGLLALGSVWLLRPYLARTQHPSRKPEDGEYRFWEWRVLLVVPLAAILVFGLAVYSEGHGWQPLKIGLAHVASYDAEGSWLANLYTMFRTDEVATVALLLGIGLLAVCRGPRGNLRTGESWYEVAGFCVVAALATLWQFRTRPYGHYALLTVPCVVIAVVILTSQVLLPRWGHRGDRRRSVVGIVLALVPLLMGSWRSGTVAVWRVLPGGETTCRTLWHQQPRVKRDLERVAEIVKPGSLLHVLPPRHRSIHYLTGGRSTRQRGYGFRSRPLPELPWTAFDWVILVTSGLDESDQKIWGEPQTTASVQCLLENGFQQQLKLETMLLYQRPAPAFQATLPDQ